MVSKQTIVAALAPFKNKETLLVDVQTTDDIVEGVLDKQKKYASQYDAIYKYFDTGDIYKTAQGLFDFLKRNVPYTKESSDFQTVKSPAAILQPGQTVDCKNYSLFIGGVLAAIKRNEGDKWTWDYRYASYNNDPDPAHVFVVVNEPGYEEIWIDPVLKYFNEKKEPTYMMEIKRKGIAGLYEISGPNDMINGQGGAVAVDKDKAIQSFLIGVNMNLFSLRNLLLSDATVLYGPVKRYFLANGYPFDTLINVLQNGKR